MEIWKKIDSFEYYEISNLGNVKSLDRNVKAKFGSNKIMKGKNITPILDKDGYHVIRLYSDKMYNRFIHRLVAITFLPNFEDNEDTVAYKKVADKLFLVKLLK